MKKRNQYTKQKKAEIVIELLKEEKTVNQIASEYGIHPSQLTQWKKKALEGLPEIFERGENAAQKAEKEYQQQIEQLYKEIGYLTTQVKWLKKKSGIQDD
jgi:transposase